MHWSFEVFAGKQSSIDKMLNKSRGLRGGKTKTSESRASLVQLPVLKTSQHPQECHGADFVNTGKYYTALLKRSGRIT